MTTKDENLISQHSDEAIYEPPKDIVEITKQAEGVADKPGPKTKLDSNVRNIILAIGVALVLFHVYTGVFGVLEIVPQRALHLGAVVLGGWLIEMQKAKNPLHKYLLAAVALVTCFASLWMMDAYPRIAFSMNSTALDIGLGIFLIFSLLELGRRSMGFSMPFLTFLFLVYALVGPWMPGRLSHRGLSIRRLVDWIYLSTDGIYGMPIGVMSQFIFLFILFGWVLLATGTGQLIIDLAYGLAGKARGGPAKVGIVASAAFGTISGSAVANVVSVGSFTIPMMKQVGYSPVYAGAIGAAASTGGVIMPPVMGAAAFIMAEMLNVTYNSVCIAAAIPACLYYAALFVQVHLAAVRTGMKGMTQEQLPDVKKIFKERWHLMLGPAFLVYTLVVLRRSPMWCAGWSILVTLAVSCLSAKTRVTFKGLLEICSNSIKGTVSVTGSCALAGIIIGVVSITGLGVKISSFIVGLSGGNIGLMLFLTMIVSLILGMGLSAGVAFIIPAMMVLPILVSAGIPKMAAGLFIFYFACISYITPPVALAAYAAAGVAQANASAVGWRAFALGISGFIVPYLLIADPSLILIGSTTSSVIAIGAALLGITGLSAFIEGWLFSRLNIPERVVLLVGSLFLLYPKAGNEVGTLLLVVGAAINWWRTKQATRVPAAGQAV